MNNELPKGYELQEAEGCIYMYPALELSNRTLMMDSGNIVFDAAGEERAALTVDDLLSKFRQGAGKELDNDRILLS